MITIAVWRGKRKIPLEVELISPEEGWEKGYDPALLTVRSEHGTVFQCGRKAVVR